MIKKILFLLVTVPVVGCTLQSTPQDILSVRERKMCDSLEIDSTLINDIRIWSSGIIEPFHYSLSKEYKNGKMIESAPIHLKALVIREKNSNSYELVLNLKEGFNRKGYSIFLLENNFNIDNMYDLVGVLKTTDQFSVLQQVATDGINYDITNDSLISLMRQFDKKYSLDLIGASGDWCEFIIRKEPADWMVFANEVYRACPDVVDQGTGTVEALAEEMKRTKRLYFWWD